MCAVSKTRAGIIGFLLVVSGAVLNVGLRGTPVLGCSLLLGEEITGHLQLPLISRGVWLEPSERPVGGCRWMAGKYNETETNVFQLSSPKLCPFTVLNMHVQIDLVCLPPQPNHPFPLKTDSFMCRYHVIMCCCAASSDSVSEGLTSRHKGRRGGRQPKSLNSILQGAKHVEHDTRSLPFSHSFLSSFLHPLLPFLYLLFHLFIDLSQHMPWKSLNELTCLRKTSVRWCKCLTYSSFLFSLQTCHSFRALVCWPGRCQRWVLLRQGTAQVGNPAASSGSWTCFSSITTALLGGQCSDVARKAEIVYCTHSQNGHVGRQKGGVVFLFCSIFETENTSSLSKNLISVSVIPLTLLVPAHALFHSLRTESPVSNVKDTVGEPRCGSFCILTVLYWNKGQKIREMLIVWLKGRKQ